jgi:hypothetical protein
MKAYQAFIPAGRVHASPGISSQPRQMGLISLVTKFPPAEFIA